MTDSNIADIADARAALAGIKQFWCLDDSEITITRLGGLTNRVFRVDHAGEQYVLRLPGKGTEEYINRGNEAQAARETAKAGVSPDVIYFDLKTGVMITRLVDDAVTMTPENFRTMPDTAGRAGDVMKKLHTSEAKFASRFELFAMIDDYLKVLAAKKAELPEGYHQVVKEADAVRSALAKHPAPLAPCHCDPLCENFLDDGRRMWMVDWEYAGMNDPMWDLGDLSVEAGFDAAQDEEMIRAYFGREPTAAERGRIVIYKAMCDLLWTLWGLIQHVNHNPADDFWAYALNRFNRCKVLLAEPSFAGHVAAVAKG